MAITRTIRAEGDLCIFAETSSGRFGYVNDATSKTTTNTTTDNTMKVVGVSKTNTPKKIPLSWLGVYLTDHDGYCIATASYTITPIYSYSTALTGFGYKITIIDEHGTHSGTQNCTDEKPPPEGYCIGVKHKETTTSGLQFAGWKVTIVPQYTSYRQPSFLSTGGTTSGNITTFPADYLDAVVILMGQDWAVSSITIEALYEPIAPSTKTIALDPNEGTVSPTSVECTGTYANAVAKIPTRSGYLFLGWFDNASGGNEITAEAEITASSPTTIYAHWEEVPVGAYAITYVLNGGTGGPQSTTVTQGESYTIPSDVPTKESYTFDGWLVGSDTTVRQPGYTFTPEGDTTISAKWSGGPRPPRPSHQLDYMVYGGGGQLNYSISGGALVYAV